MRNLVLLLMLISGTVFAQKNTVSGSIKDASNGEDIFGAVVKVKELTNVGTVSNAYGFYSLTLDSGTYTLIYRASGFDAQEVVVELTEDKELNIELEIPKEVQEIEEVKEEGGFLHYQVKGEWIPEAALADTISFSNPLDRLMGRQLDEPHLFNVRNEALTWQSRIRKAPNRGFTGGRVDLIEHQLYLAQEVTNRLQPRVLLADEVGLGKTIEAGMVLKEYLLRGMVERVLVLVPASDAALLLTFHRATASDPLRS